MISELRWTKPGSASWRAGEAFARAPVPLPPTSTGRCLELYGIPEAPLEEPTPAETALSSLASRVKTLPVFCALDAAPRARRASRC